MILGLILLVFGIIYLIKPDIFKRWFWKKTDIFQKIFNENQYLIFMRILGSLLIIFGLIIIIIKFIKKG